MAGISLAKKQSGRKQPTIAVKVAVLGGPVKTISLHPSATFRDLVTHLTELGLYGYGSRLMRGGEVLKSESHLHDGDTIIVAPTIHCGCGKIVRFGFTTPWPSQSDVEALLAEYIGDPVSVRHDEDGRKWECQLPGGKGREFRVYWEDSQIRTYPHDQDHFTKAVADGFAALCERTWNKELDSHAPEDD